MDFVSRRRQLRIVIKPADRVMDEQRRVTQIRGATAEFSNNKFSTEDPYIIEKLLTHGEYGAEFTSVQDGPGWLKEIEANRKSIVVVSGARSTTNIAGGPREEAPLPTRPTEVVATSPDLQTIIKDEIAKAMAQIREELKPKEKRVFKCKKCDEVFPSGYDVGAHMKIAHPKPAVAAIPKE
jgi:hypothetical protein